MPPHTLAEMLRTPLEELVLQVKNAAAGMCGCVYEREPSALLVFFFSVDCGESAGGMLALHNYDERQQHACGVCKGRGRAVAFYRAKSVLGGRVVLDGGARFRLVMRRCK